MPSWSRADNRPLSKHFRANEFDCHCGVCSMQHVDELLIDKLEAVRTELGLPITITSGFRCARYQQILSKDPKIETVKNSSHCGGQAADLYCKDMDKLLEIVDKHFVNVGIAKGFIHVDTRPPAKPGAKRRWYYK